MALVQVRIILREGRKLKCAAFCITYRSGVETAVVGRCLAEEPASQSSQEVDDKFQFNVVESFH